MKQMFSAVYTEFQNQLVYQNACVCVCVCVFVYMQIEIVREWNTDLFFPEEI